MFEIHPDRLGDRLHPSGQNHRNILFPLRPENRRHRHAARRVPQPRRPPPDTHPRDRPDRIGRARSRPRGSARHCEPAFAGPGPAGDPPREERPSDPNYYRSGSFGPLDSAYKKDIIIK